MSRNVMHSIYRLRLYIWLGLGLLLIERSPVIAAVAGKRTFKAYVLDDRGLPIGGAEIILKWKAPKASGETPGAVLSRGKTHFDKRGWFSVPEVPEGDYLITVRAAGHEFAQDVPYTLGMFSPPLRVILKRYATSTLRVIGVDGELLRNASLNLSFTDTRYPKLAEDPLGAKRERDVTTDKNGIATVAELPASEYQLFAILPRQAYGLLDRIILTPGAGPEPRDLPLHKSGVLQIKVQEASTSSDANSASEKSSQPQAGRALGGAYLEFLGPLVLPVSAERLEAGTYMVNFALGRKNSELITRDGDGFMEWANLPPTYYEFRIVLPGFKSPTQKVVIEAGETASLEFKLQREPTVPANELRVLVHDARGEPVADKEFRIYLQPQSPGEFKNHFPWRRARTDAKGRFSLYPVPAGTWKIDLTFPRKEGAAFHDNDHLTTETKTVTVPADNALVEFDLGAARHRN